MAGDHETSLSPKTTEKNHSSDKSHSICLCLTHTLSASLATGEGASHSTVSVFPSVVHDRHLASPRRHRSTFHSHAQALVRRSDHQLSRTKSRSSLDHEQVAFRFTTG